MAVAGGGGGDDEDGFAALERVERGSTGTTICHVYHREFFQPAKPVISDGDIITHMRQFLP